jgi:xanthine dehydrogenase accessory factor
MESRVIEEAQKALADGQARVVSYELADPARGDPGVCGGQLEIFIEPITPHPTIVVVGAGHVGKAVAHLAKWLGFRVLVSDDRQELCTSDTIPEGDKFYPGPLDTLIKDVQITPHTYFILCTRNVLVDVDALPEILETPAGYIGVIGSRRRWATTREKLIEAGVTEKQINRVVSPMGLELNAETPEEIAVSIIAQIIMLRRGGEGGAMSSLEGEER